ncbi:MAG TPA: hypothetical protein VIV88_17635 [Gemmatimonadales bacterium]
MATKEQYAFFRALYDEEEHTYDQLEARARLYLTIISLFLAALLLKADEAKRSAEALGLPWFLLTTVALLLAGALLLVVIAMRIRTYEGPADPQAIIEGFADEPPTDDTFLDERIVDLAVATNRNSVANNKTATTLQYASYCLVLAMFILLVGIAYGFRS